MPETETKYTVRVQPSSLPAPLLPWVVEVSTPDGGLAGLDVAFTRSGARRLGRRIARRDARQARRLRPATESFEVVV